MLGHFCLDFSKFGYVSKKDRKILERGGYKIMKNTVSKVISFFLWTWSNEHLGCTTIIQAKVHISFLHSVGQKPFFKLCGHLIYPIMYTDLSIIWSIKFIQGKYCIVPPPDVNGPLKIRTCPSYKETKITYRIYQIINMT